MSKSELENYLHNMQMSGCLGDGIMLSVAARLYGRPVEIVLGDGSVSSIDIGNTGIVSPTMQPIRMSLVGNHYVSIQDIVLVVNSMKSGVSLPLLHSQTS